MTFSLLSTSSFFKLPCENFTSSFCRLRQNITKKRAARAARLFFFIQPIKSLIFVVVIAVTVLSTPDSPTLVTWWQYCSLSCHYHIFLSNVFVTNVLGKTVLETALFQVLAIVLAKVPPLGITSPSNCSLFCSHVKCIWLGDLFFNSLSLDGNDHFISSVLSLNIVGFIRSCHWTQINPFLFWSFV